MSGTTDVSILVGSKVVLDLLDDLKNKKVDQAKELPASSILNGVLPTPSLAPENQDYKIEISGGLTGVTFTHSSMSPVSLTKGQVALAYFSGDLRIWNILNKQDLPSRPVVKSLTETVEGNALDATQGRELDLKKLDEAALPSKMSEEFGVQSAEIDTLYVSDEEGNVAFKVSNEGVEYRGQVNKNDLDNLASKEAIAEEIADKGLFSVEDDVFAVSDAQGNVIFKANKDEVKYIGQSNIGNASYNNGTFLADINLVINYGQSLSKSGSISTADNYYDSLTFVGGVNVNYDPADSVARDAYFGSDFVPIPTNGNDYAKPLLKVIKQLINSDNGLDYSNQDYTLVTSSPGLGGASWSQLSDINGIYYKRLLELVSYGKKFAIARGKTFNVPVVTYIQGEHSSDKNKTVQQFYDNLTSLFTSLNTDIKAITEQSNDLQFITYQTASFGRNSGGTGVPLALLKAATDLNNVHLGSAMYHFNYTDTVHLQVASTRTMYAAMGGIVHRVLINQSGPKQHIHPINHIIQHGDSQWIVQLKMQVPVSPLVFDESVNNRYDSVPLHKGFSILSNNIEIIESVSILRGNTINIVCNENPSGKILTYAILGSVSGGNLRDSQGDKLTMTQSDFDGRVDNWCPIFTYNL